MSAAARTMPPLPQAGSFRVKILSESLHSFTMFGFIDIPAHNLDTWYGVKNWPAFELLVLDFMYSSPR